MNRLSSLKYLCWLLLTFSTQFSFSQKLSKKEKTYLNHKLDSMLVDDQRYRFQIMLGEMDSARLDSLIHLPDSAFWNRVNQVSKKEVGINKQTSDSLWQLQSQLDSFNYYTFVEIIKKYGYPSYKRTNSSASLVLSIHFMEKWYFENLLMLFKKELILGNLPPTEFASWYDRHNYVNGKQQLYGAYNTKYPCVENLEKTNAERKKIGLKPLKHNACK